jgi:hypothetical protein
MGPREVGITSGLSITGCIFSHQIWSAVLKYQYLESSREEISLGRLAGCMVTIITRHENSVRHEGRRKWSWEILIVINNPLPILFVSTKIIQAYRWVQKYNIPRCAHLARKICAWYTRAYHTNVTRMLREARAPRDVTFGPICTCGLIHQFLEEIHLGAN